MKQRLIKLEFQVTPDQAATLLECYNVLTREEKPPVDTTTLRTAKEWAELLPDDVKAKFLANCIRLDYECESLHEAIARQFDWYNTKQDYLYWRDIHTKALNNEYPCNL
jgi:hypothetical protein